MKKYITEFLGTMFLFLGAAFAGGLGAALILMAMIYAGGHISGAHYNPAVTLSVLIRNRISFMQAMIYWISQFAGALIGAVLFMYVFGFEEGRSLCMIPDEKVMAGFCAELLGTFVLAYVVLNVATAKSTAGNSFYGIAIAGALYAVSQAFGQFSGGAFNPAIAVGMSLAKLMCWKYLYIYIIATFVGGALAAAIFRLSNTDDK
ncbi:MIP/aquaporin family protein [soil metagenome]